MCDHSDPTPEDKHLDIHNIWLVLGAAAWLFISACGSSESKANDAGTDIGQDRGSSDARDGGRDGSSVDSGAGQADAPNDAQAIDGPASGSFNGDRRQPLTPANDVQFIDFFVPHHRSAIMMATTVTGRGTTPAVMALAQRIVMAQTEEIATMRAARTALAGAADSPITPPDPHMEREMDEMEMLSGIPLERMFLMDMIPHHGGGIPVAHCSVAVLVRSDLKSLAMAMYATQAREIGEMQMLLESLGKGGTDGGLGDADAGAPDGGAADDTNPTGDRRIPYTAANDVAFIDFFVPHHRSAIQMADMIVAKGAGADVKAMAQIMRDTQTAEIALMRQARQALAGTPDSPALPSDPHMDADMARMMTLTGEALDRMFLDEMIPHHAGGLPTAHRSMPHLSRSDMQKLAEDMFDDQAREIGEMQKKRQSSSTDGGTDASPGQ